MAPGTALEVPGVDGTANMTLIHRGEVTEPTSSVGLPGGVRDIHGAYKTDGEMICAGPT